MNFADFMSIQSLKNFVTKGHERSVRAKKNILTSLIIRGVSMGISFITLPITLDYVDSSTYGVWLTMSSIVAWFSFFDIGLTQGMRNKFAEAKAAGNDQLARIYVSTTYGILGIVFTVIWLLFLVVNNFLDWSTILNVSQTMKSEVSTMAIIVFTYFCLNFVLNIIATILMADQEPARNSVISLISQAISLIVIIILVKTTEGSLIKLAYALCIAPIFVLLAANILLFKNKYRRYRPAFSHVKFSYAKNLFNLGVVFFVIQVAGIIQYQTASIIIARNFGTADVTAYNVVYKYFGMAFMIFTIFLTPFWSASTEAYHKHDFDWIRNGMRRYNQLNVLMLLGTIIMLVVSGTVYRLWLGEGKVLIAFSLSLWGFMYYNVMTFGSKYVQFLNGISALRIQFIASVISPLLYIGIVMILIKKLNIGVHALFIGSIIANFNGFILAPLQYHMLMNRNKSGIWIK